MVNEQVKSNIPKMPVLARRPSKPLFINGRVCNLHYHDELEFLPVFEGEFTCIVDGERHTARVGEVIFINSGVPHETFANGAHLVGLLQVKESHFMNSELSKTVKYSAKLTSLTETKAKVISAPEIFAIIDEILKENEKKEPSYEVFIRGCIYKLFGCLYRAGLLSDSEVVYSTKEAKRILPVLDYVNKHYSEEITLDGCCSMLGFAASYFCRLFKAATGATFTEYLNFVRICHAEKLLTDTERSILDVSETVGFSSVSYFNRIFKRYRGCSPSHYRSALYANM